MSPNPVRDHRGRWLIMVVVQVISASP